MSVAMALLGKRLRDHWAILALGAGLIWLICLAFVYLNNLIGSVQQLEQVWAYLLTLYKTITGREAPDRAASMSVPRFVAGAYLTAMTQATLIAFPIAVAARGLAGEISAGTADLLLAQPIRRGTLYAVNAAVIAIGAAVFGAVGLATIAAASQLVHTIEPLPLDRFAWVALNAASLSFCVGGIAMLFSAGTSEYGRAVLAPAAVVLVVAVFELIASMWDALAPVRPLGLYYYFNPLHIADGAVHSDLRDAVSPAVWAWLASAVLLAVGGAAMLGGYLLYRRRDIATL